MELTTLNNKTNKLEMINSIKDNYSKQVKKFSDYIQSLGKIDFEYNDLQLYYEYLLNGGLSYTYINNLIFTIKKELKIYFSMKLILLKNIS